MAGSESLRDRSGPIPAIVLAAGLSRRMGRFKPLLPIDGRPMVAHVVEMLVRSGVVAPVIVVTGHNSERVGSAVAGGGHVTVVHNDRYEAGGMASSVQAGVRALPAGAAGFLIVLGDQPAVRPETVARLVAAWQTGAASIAVPVYHTRRGHPIVLSSRCAAEVLELADGQTLKAVVTRHEGDRVEVPVDDSGVVVDVDTPEDYERLLKDWLAYPTP